MAFDWSDLIVPILTSGAQLFGGIYNSDIQQDQLEEQNRREDANTLLQLQLEALKAGYGKGSAGTPMWNPLDMKLGERAALTQNANQAKVNQLNQIIAAFQNGLR